MPERRQVHEQGLRNARRLILQEDPPHVAMIEVASPGDEHVAIRGDSWPQRFFGLCPEIRADDVQRASESPGKRVMIWLAMRPPPTCHPHIRASCRAASVLSMSLSPAIAARMRCARGCSFPKSSAATQMRFWRSSSAAQFSGSSPESMGFTNTSTPLEAAFLGTRTRKAQWFVGIERGSEGFRFCGRKQRRQRGGALGRGRAPAHARRRSWRATRR